LENWELYDLETDRTETKDLVSEYPQKVQEMAAKWMTWAKKVMVVPKPER
jgi:arylsulfatase